MSLYGFLWELGICVELISLDTSVDFNYGLVQPLHHKCYVISLCVAKNVVDSLSVSKAEEVYYAIASLLFLMSTQCTQRLFQLFLLPSDLHISTGRSGLLYAQTLVLAFTHGKQMAESYRQQNI